MLFSASTTRAANFLETGLKPKAAPADIKDSEDKQHILTN